MFPRTPPDIKAHRPPALGHNAIARAFARLRLKRRLWFASHHTALVLVTTSSFKGIAHVCCFALRTLIVCTLLTNSLAKAQPADNPLLTDSPLPLRYPQFDKLRDEHFGLALDRGMAAQLAQVQAIADNLSAPTFDNTVLAMERSGFLLSRTTALLYGLLDADANLARQQLQAEYAPRLAAHRDAVWLNPKLFARVEAVHAASVKSAPNAEARRLMSSSTTPMNSLA